MSSRKDFLKEWFGFTRRERRSTSILLAIIAVITGIRYFAPERSISVEKIPVSLSEYLDKPEYGAGGQKDSETLRSLAIRQRPRRAVEINSADSAALTGLPGIGPVLSARIIKYRRMVGGFVTTGQLREVYGLKEETFLMLKPKIIVDSSLIRKIKINVVTYKEMLRHPYFSRKEIEDILKYRELNGRITGTGEIRKNNLMTPQDLGRIRPYLDFGL